MADKTYTAEDGSTYATEAELIQHNVYKLRDFLNTLPNDTIRQAVEFPENVSSEALSALTAGANALSAVIGAQASLKLTAPPFMPPVVDATDATTQSELEGAAAKATELSGASQ